MFRPVVNTVQVLLKGHMGGQGVLNTFYYKFPGQSPPNAADLTALLNAWVFQFAGAITELYTTDIVFNELVARDLTTAGGLQVSLDINPVIQGGVATDRNPGNSSLSLRRRTPLAGRTNRGRVSLMPFPEAQSQGDTISNGWVTRVTDFAAAMLRDFVKPSGGMFEAATPNFKDGISNVITSIIFDVLLDSMKTRLTGHGT